MTSDTTRLQCTDVTLHYQGAAGPVVTDLTLTIPDGLVTTIIGPNGCGKSTLLRALGRLMRPDSGCVVLDGQLIHRLPSKEVARRLGLLQQQAAAPEGITVEDLARRGRYPHQGFLQPPSRRDLEAVNRALELAGMENLRHHEVDQLSGGQRQRAWIAMALAQETDLLLLDEPTTFLDLAHQREILDLVGQLHADGKTVVMVLHDINEAASSSHHVVAMKDGHVQRAGLPEEIVEEHLLRDLYGVECEVVDHPIAEHRMCIPRSAPRDWTERRIGIDATAVGVRVRALDTGYGPSATISRGLSVELPAGGITSIVGPNGCGKSTLLRTGARVLKALAGEFTVAGVDTAKGSRRSLARRVATVMQGPTAPGGFLVEDLVGAGRIAHQNLIRQWSHRDEEMVTSALKRCDLVELRYREVDSLSGGQRQRAWIAMALAQDTPYLFLDEPTTFLDIGYQIEVLDLVSRLNRDDGRTIVMVLHDLNLAARYSDHIVAMKEGRIVADGPPSAVITRATVREVFGIDSHIEIDSPTGRPMVVPLRDEPSVEPADVRSDLIATSAP